MWRAPNIFIPDEQYRIEHYTSGEFPLISCDYIVMEYETGSDCVEKVRAVMAMVASFKRENWPPDEYWLQSLPKWLLDNFRTYTKEEMNDINAGRMEGPLQWMFEAWTERMRDRDWEWWSIAKNDTQFTVYFTIDGWPYSVGPLKALIEAAGGRVIYEF